MPSEFVEYIFGGELAFVGWLGGIGWFIAVAAILESREEGDSWLQLINSILQATFVSMTLIVSVNAAFSIVIQIPNRLSDQSDQLGSQLEQGFDEAKERDEKDAQRIMRATDRGIDAIRGEVTDVAGDEKDRDEFDTQRVIGNTDRGVTEIMNRLAEIFADAEKNAGDRSGRFPPLSQRLDELSKTASWKPNAITQLLGLYLGDVRLFPGKGDVILRFGGSDDGIRISYPKGKLTCRFE